MPDSKSNESLGKVGKVTRKAPEEGKVVQAFEAPGLNYKRSGLRFEQGRNKRWRWYAYGEGDKLQAQGQAAGQRTLADAIKDWDNFTSHVAQTHPGTRKLVQDRTVAEDALQDSSDRNQDLKGEAQGLKNQVENLKRTNSFLREDESTARHRLMFAVSVAAVLAGLLLTQAFC